MRKKKAEGTKMALEMTSLSIDECSADFKREAVASFVGNGW